MPEVGRDRFEAVAVSHPPETNHTPRIDGGSFDAVVVGAGPAGVVCTARLAGSGRSTLLIEAGPGELPKAGRLGLIPPDVQPHLFWPPIVEASAAESGSVTAGTDYWTGRAVGGGSAVNGMLLSRGSAADYDRWAQTRDCPGWSGRDMDPWLDKAESVLAPEVDSAPSTDPTVALVSSAFDQVALAGGWWAPTASTLDPDARGLLFPALSTLDGRRQSVADAYLGRDRSLNPTVVTDTTVDRVDVERGRARGVRLAGGEVVTAPLVVLAAGAIGSPRLLARSGVGSGVGSKVANHPAVAAVFRWPGSGDPDSATRVRRVLRLDVDPDSGAVVDPAAADPESATDPHPSTRRTVEVQLIGPFGRADEATGTLLMVLLDPASSGRMVDPASDRPTLLTNRFADQADRRAGRAALRYLSALANDFTRTIGLAPPTVGKAPTAVPLSTLGSLGDSALDALLRENPGPVFHAVGACRMGARPGNGTCTSCEPTAAGAVWNVAGLVVADTSIFPDLVSGGLQLPAVAVAERVAHWLVG